MDRFISSEEIEAIRKKKQEEWEKKRTADQPLIRPEEPVDNRSLAERLQDNADKKQAEFDEKFALKNQIYMGMDDDEFEHISTLAQEEYERTVARQKREGEEIQEFKKKQRTTPADERAKKQPAIKLVATTHKPKNELSALKSLASAIRKKSHKDQGSSSDGGSNAGAAAVATTASTGSSQSTHNDASSKSAAAVGKEPSASTAAAAGAAAGGGLGGLVAYGSSSDDDDSDDNG
eukprot:m.7457 g.7457  ORF g.7457 m.7457 type:complete len:234 (-) comp2449_c0_seq1:1811-2512(-)